jgi:hypothetical protein
VQAKWDFTGLLASVKVKNLANVREDSLGNIYVTDSRNGAVYKGDRNGEVSVFVQDESLLPADVPDVGVVGIEFLPASATASNSGILVVSRAAVKESLGGLMRIDVQSKKLSPIALNKGLYTGAWGLFAGLAYNPRSDRLFIAGASDNTIYEFASDDNWKSATLMSQFNARCSTPIAVQYVQSPYNDVYALCTSAAGASLQRVQVEKINVIPYTAFTYESSSHLLSSSNSASALEFTRSTMVVMVVLAGIAMLL